MGRNIPCEWQSTHQRDSIKTLKSTLWVHIIYIIMKQRYTEIQKCCLLFVKVLFFCTMTAGDQKYNIIKWNIWLKFGFVWNRRDSWQKIPIAVLCRISFQAYHWLALTPCWNWHVISFMGKAPFWTDGKKQQHEKLPVLIIMAEFPLCTACMCKVKEIICCYYCSTELN